MNWLKMLTTWALVLAACSTEAYAYQKVDQPATKPVAKDEKPLPIEFITADQLKTKIAANEPVVIIDLRSPSSFQQSDKRIKGAIFTKYRKVASRFRNEPRDKEVVIYCACPADELAVLGAEELQRAGFKRVRALKGGWQAWLQAGGQVQPKRRLP
jgi:rhodanese-related sulfurtransferase